MAAKSPKMATTELQIGKIHQYIPWNSNLRLQFLLITCFMHMMWKDVFKFQILITDEPMKNQNGGQQIQNGCH